MQNDLISRSERLRQIRQTELDDYRSAMLISDAKKMIRTFIEEAPAVDAVEVDKAMAWLEGYTMTDTKQIYSNGIVYVPMFRVEQAFVDKAYNGLQEG